MYKEIGLNLFELEKKGQMRVPGLVIATEAMLQSDEMEKPLQQVMNVATLPGIIDYSIAMPDIHWGYGFPIGGVAAMDIEAGVISPGGVGYDINCGVRLALVPMNYTEIENPHYLLEELFRLIPSGLGRESKNKELTASDYMEIFNKGAAWSIELGKGCDQDLEATESYGCIAGADGSSISSLSKERGAKQMGTIGSGNHFCEIGVVEKIFDQETASLWGLYQGQVYILIHSGSRGFGHQVCTDTLDQFMRKGFAQGLPDKQLVAAPILSAEGKQYLSAMACAANYAFNNRQQILDAAREAFRKVCGIQKEVIRQLYDVCHNIAKFEEHLGRKLCVHRKGATRAFGPQHPELPSRYKNTGQPVIIPGDMARASYVLAGQGNPLTWCSCCHGAGRIRSRVKANAAWKGRDPFAYMKQHGVEVMAASTRTITEEMPDAYKDVDEVVEVTHNTGLARKVVRLKPKLVIKG